MTKRSVRDVLESYLRANYILNGKNLDQAEKEIVALLPSVDEIKGFIKKAQVCRKLLDIELAKAIHRAMTARLIKEDEE